MGQNDGDAHLSALLDYYKLCQLSEKNPYTGVSTLHYANKIASIVRRTKSKTLLDYGCGRGDQYSAYHLDKLWNCYVTCYDPAVASFSARPKKKFDVVICCDVLEHIEESDVMDALCDIASLAKNAVFASISIVPSKNSLPDGRNVHVCVKSKAWWKSVVSKSNKPWYVAWKNRWNVEMEDSPI